MEKIIPTVKGIFIGTLIALPFYVIFSSTINSTINNYVRRSGIDISDQVKCYRFNNPINAIFADSTHDLSYYNKLVSDRDNIIFAIIKGNDKTDHCAKLLEKIVDK